MSDDTTVNVIVDGKEYHGTYSISGRKTPMITVFSSFGQKTIQVGGTPVESQARLLLTELVHHNKAK